MQARAKVLSYQPRDDEAAAGMKPGWQVQTVWESSQVHIDRPEGVGFILGQKLALCERLAKAIEAGAVFTDPKLKRDVHGKFYVTSDITVRGRCLNADLRRLGF